MSESLTALAADLEPFVKGYIEEVVGEHRGTSGHGASDDEFIVKLFDVSASEVREYEHNAAGFDAALAEAASGDLITIPPGTIPDAHTIGAGIEVRGAGINSILSGDLTVNNGILNNLFVSEIDPGAAFLYGIEQGTLSGNGIFGFGHDIGSGAGNPQYCIIGGSTNVVAGDWNIVGGEENNLNWACTDSIVAGFSHVLTDGFTVCFGRNHTISSDYGGIFAGHTNEASATYAVILGGTGCIASGAYSLAWGTQAKTSHAGAMLLADRSAFDFASGIADEFAVRATGGFRFVSAIDGAGATTHEMAVEPNGVVTTDSGRILGTTRITGVTTLDATYDEVFADSDGGAYTVTLPAGVQGTRYRIINCGSSGNDLTIDGNGAEKVRGALTQTVSDGEILVLVYDATEGWW